MKREFSNYYLGLDVGTDSVGWAVTDEQYNLLKFNGKYMWGIHLFEQGETAEARRKFRSSRRRSDRKKQRIALLQELFSEEISKVDPGFFLRISESKFLKDDKTELQTNTLFNDNDYCDKDYHRDYPTVYHLRRAFINDTVKKYDIRLLYLAIAHILKNRGHFLLQGEKFNTSSALEELFLSFSEVASDEMNTEFICKDMSALENILKASVSRTSKKKMLQQLFAFGKNNKVELEFLTLIVGGTTSLASLFDDKTLADGELTKVNFSKGDFDENIDKYAILLGDRMDCIIAAKAIYDFSILSEILQGEASISEAKIKSYEKHKYDLVILKRVFKNNCEKHIYNNMFRNKTQQANYCAYIGNSMARNNQSVCTKDNFYKYIKEQLRYADNTDNEDLTYIFEELESGTLLPKQRTGENGVIPYQLHLEELKAILKNAERYFPFLSEKNSDNFSVLEKIISIMEFRIPYYVGPLNDAHKNDKKNGHCWIVKKSNDAVRPWNFYNNKVIDLEASAEKFIRRMTNKCTYLVGADVIPKDSLLYSRYVALNEINNLKINGKKLDIETKQQIFENLCKTKVKVRIKDIRSFLLSLGKITENDVLSGIDGDLKASLKAYIDFKKIIDTSQWDEALIEECILNLVLFAGEKDIICNRITNLFNGKISKDQIMQICKLKYSGWGRLSREFLTDIYHEDNKTNKMNIITALYKTNENLMQLLSGKWGFSKKIEEYNVNANGDITEISYESIVEPLYCSPSVKHSIWRALSIVQELEKIAGRPPKKIFIEMARENGEKKRTKSRRETLLELYMNCGVEGRQWCEALSYVTDEEMRKDKLYLYYTQMGRCMYSGKTIELKELFDDNLYDIDHIFPQSKTKDDSIENKVLVQKSLNRFKSDNYPIPANLRTRETTELWRRLYKMGLIGKTKYERLNRTEELTEDELAGFINRQIVETRQSTKALADALLKLHAHTDTEIVYVKAGNVSDFRREYDLVKVREINDFHHAKDAYLSIVVGNVYDTKFTKNRANFIKEAPPRSYSLNRMYDYDVQRDGIIAWKAGKTGTIATIKKTIESNRILFTRYAFENSGEFYKQQPLKKGNGQIPLKSQDPRYANIDRYGGYDKDSGAYFMLVDHLKNGKQIRSIEYVPIRLSKQIDKNPEILMEYCVLPVPSGLGLKEPRVLIPKIKINTLFNIEGFPVHISGRQNDSIIWKPAAQLHLDYDAMAYFKRIIKFNERRKDNKKRNNEIMVEKRDGIDFEKNLEMYDLLLKKHKDTIYKLRFGGQIGVLEEGRNAFIKLSLEKQCELLSNFLMLFRCVAMDTDLTLIGGKKRAGNVTKSKNISGLKKARIIHQSPTGLFSNTIDILSL